MCLCVFVCMCADQPWIINYSATTLAMKLMAMMTMIMMIMSIIITLSVYTMASQQQLLTYCPIHAPNGTRLCGVTNPFMPFEIFDAEKLTSCAVSTMSLNAVMFNYKANQTDTQCTVFHDPPFHYQHRNDCVAYQVTLSSVNDNYNCLAMGTQLANTSSNDKVRSTTF